MKKYTDRESRNKFIAEKFSNYLKGKVLNVGGGGKHHLLQFIKPKKYIEIDIDGNPDQYVDLEKEIPIPIKSDSFDAVICTDVLEHVENLHDVFSELFRISKQYVIISLPNGIPSAISILKEVPYSGTAGEPGEYIGLHEKFYGLPLNKPKDRHKWFFSYNEIKYFIQKKANIYNYDIIEEFPIVRGRGGLKSFIGKLLIKNLLGINSVNNWFYSTYWCVLEIKK